MMLWIFIAKNRETGDMVEYVLRTNNKNNSSHKGFRWPEKGLVEAPDWNPEAKCGQGLHGYARGEGHGLDLNWGNDALWLVVKVNKNDGYVEFDEKCKFRRGEVIFCGGRKGATDLIYQEYPYANVIGGKRNVGDGDLAIAGYRGIAIAGDMGMAVVGASGYAQSGEKGVASAGPGGIAITGRGGIAIIENYGYASIGEDGDIRWWYKDIYFSVNKHNVEPNIIYECVGGEIRKSGKPQWGWLFYETRGTNE